jgi:hypothetical protein
VPGGVAAPLGRASGARPKVSGGVFDPLGALLGHAGEARVFVPGRVVAPLARGEEPTPSCLVEWTPHWLAVEEPWLGAIAPSPWGPHGALG